VERTRTARGKHYGKVQDLDFAVLTSAVVVSNDLDGAGRFIAPKQFEVVLGADW
jgi:hypothetical protein